MEIHLISHEFSENTQFQKLLWVCNRAKCPKMNLFKHFQILLFTSCIYVYGRDILEGWVDNVFLRSVEKNSFMISWLWLLIVRRIDGYSMKCKEKWKSCGGFAMSFLQAVLNLIVDYSYHELSIEFCHASFLSNLIGAFLCVFEASICFKIACR